jgi:hypothetical protein
VFAVIASARVHICLEVRIRKLELNILDRLILAILQMLMVAYVSIAYGSLLLIVAYEMLPFHVLTNRTMFDRKYEICLFCPRLK